jgi:hypothetical protein
MTGYAFKPEQHSTTPLTRRTTTVADLSPAAAAVLDEFTGNDTIHGLHLMTPRLAAALRAAADQVVPETNGMFISHAELQQEKTRDQLLAIAAELDNTNNTSEGG